MRRPQNFWAAWRLPSGGWQGLPTTCCLRSGASNTSSTPTLRNGDLSQGGMFSETHIQTVLFFFLRKIYWGLKTAQFVVNTRYRNDQGKSFASTETIKRGSCDLYSYTLNSCKSAMRITPRYHSSSLPVAVATSVFSLLTSTLLVGCQLSALRRSGRMGCEK